MRLKSYRVVLYMLYAFVFTFVLVSTVQMCNMPELTFIFFFQVLIVDLCADKFVVQVCFWALFFSDWGVYMGISSEKVWRLCVLVERSLV